MASWFNLCSRICISLANFLLRFGLVQIIFVLWAVSFFFIVFHVYVPNVYTSQEVRLNFQGCPKDGRIFAATEFSLMENYRSVFTQGQPYHISFHLRIPDSTENRDSGMSVVQLSLFDANGKNVTTLANTVLPTYRPWLIDFADTLLFAPLYLSRVWEKEQVLMVSLADSYVDSKDSSSVHGLLQLTANKLRWYSATLCISAQLTTWVRLLYYHKWVMGLLFVTLVVASLDIFIVFFLVVRQGWKIGEHISRLLDLLPSTNLPMTSMTVDDTIQTLTAVEEEAVDLPFLASTELMAEKPITISTPITTAQPENDLPP